MYAVALASTSALLGLVGADKSSMSAPSQSGDRFCWSDGTTRRRASSCVFRLSRYLRSTWLCGSRVRLSLAFDSLFASDTVASVDGDLLCVVSGLKLVEGDLVVENLRPSGPLDSLSLRFRFGRVTCSSCGSNGVSMTSGSG